MSVIAALAAAAVMPRWSRGENLILSEAPAYSWFHGCSPTSGMMVFGYWDSHGYDNLISGSNNWLTNRSTIKNAIASPGHIADYALYGIDPNIPVGDDGLARQADGTPTSPVEDYRATSPVADLSSIAPANAHADNCLADFMGTSRSSAGLIHGGTRPSEIFGLDIESGMQGYASYRGYAFDAKHVSSPAWEDFTREIKLGRMVLLDVDATADHRGITNHTIAAIGYRTLNGVNQYGCYDTWTDDLRWEQFRPVSADYAWGINAMNTVRPTGTWDAEWKVTAGDWNDTGSWNNDFSHLFSVPDATTFTYIPSGGSAQVLAAASAKMLNLCGNVDVQAATLSLGSLRVCPGGALFLQHNNSTVQVSSEIVNAGGLISGHGRISASINNSGSVRAAGGLLELVGTIAGDGTVTVTSAAALSTRSGGQLRGQLSNNGYLSVDAATLQVQGIVSGIGDYEFINSAIGQFNTATASLQARNFYVDNSTVTVSRTAASMTAQDLHLDNGSQFDLATASTSIVNAYIDRGSRLKVTAGILSCRDGGNIYLNDSAELSASNAVATANLFLSRASHFKSAGDTTLTGNLYVDGASDVDVGGSSAVFSVHNVYADAGTAIGITALSFTSNDLFLGGVGAKTQVSFSGGTFSAHDVHLTNSELSLAGANVIDIRGFIDQGSGSQITYGGSNVTFTAPYANAGTLNVAGGKLTFSGGYTQGTGVLNLDAGTISASTPLVLQAGMLTGTGTIDTSVNTQATVSPGHSIGTIAVHGDFSQGNAGVLAIELGGVSSTDTLRIDGTAAFDGVLQVLLLNDFLPLPGQSFDVVTFGSHTGDLFIENLTGYAGLSFEHTFSTNTLTVSAIALFKGDANLDGAVDTLDFTSLALHFSGSGNWLAGDFNGDSLVNALDFNALASSYGASVVPPESASGAMVPEPTTFSFVILALPVWRRRCKCTRNRSLRALTSSMGVIR